VELTTLYRPIGPKERNLLEASGWTRYPEGLFEQLVFYPGSHLESAVQSARTWYVLAYGSGFITKVELPESFIDSIFASNEKQDELWVQANSLEEFNQQIVGEIEVLRSFSARQ
jgi:hypothetical protein